MMLSWASGRIQQLLVPAYRIIAEEYLYRPKKNHLSPPTPYEIRNYRRAKRCSWWGTFSCQRISIITVYRTGLWQTRRGPLIPKVSLRYSTTMKDCVLINVIIRPAPILFSRITCQYSPALILSGASPFSRKKLSTIGPKTVDTSQTHSSI